jgi:hypothetical protein
VHAAVFLGRGKLKHAMLVYAYTLKRFSLSYSLEGQLYYKAAVVALLCLKAVA